MLPSPQIAEASEACEQLVAKAQKHLDADEGNPGIRTKGFQHWWGKHVRKALCLGRIHASWMKSFELNFKSIQ